MLAMDFTDFSDFVPVIASNSISQTGTPLPLSKSSPASPLKKSICLPLAGEGSSLVDIPRRRRSPKHRPVMHNSAMDNTLAKTAAFCVVAQLPSSERPAGHNTSKEH